MLSLLGLSTIAVNWLCEYEIKDHDIEVMCLMGTFFFPKETT